MTRMTWDALAERRFETGVDRGVLYPAVGIGVAWNGLISVNESPIGGEVSPVYYDGQRVLNLASAEEFEAVLTAFSAPTEFNASEGSTEIQSGLYVTQQPKKSFGLSYRTLVGDALQGTDLGYKIHLVYGCMVDPSSRTMSTTSSSATPTTLSWKISTVPELVTNHRPTAHFVVDTRTASQAHVSSLEDLLYGTVSTNPGLPTVSALVALFSA